MMPTLLLILLFLISPWSIHGSCAARVAVVCKPIPLCSMNDFTPSMTAGVYQCSSVEGFPLLLIAVLPQRDWWSFTLQDLTRVSKVIARTPWFMSRGSPLCPTCSYTMSFLQTSNLISRYHRYSSFCVTKFCKLVRKQCILYESIIAM